MKPGDLVKLDIPGYPHHGMVGIIVDMTVTGKLEYGWKPRYSYRKPRYSYHVLVGGKVSRFPYEELLAAEDWEDETR